MSSNPVVAQPEWLKPASNSDRVVLKVNNSMTHSKTEFIPANGKNVKWYTCGPTVYDASHLGHARTYISFDVMRRIMEDYFNYDILYVMNITDVDDKIIISARQKYLFNKKKASASKLTSEIIAELEEAWADFVESKLGTWLPKDDANTSEFASVSLRFTGLESIVRDGGAPSAVDVPKFDMWLKAAKRSLTAITQARLDLASGTVSKEAVDKLYDENADTFSAFLDKKLKETVTDPAIFREYAAYWENEYFKDMDALNIRRPDVLTRVSEYIPEIVTYVEQIIKNGYAYAADGDVYFDTFKFDRDPNHSYAKLEPWSASNLKLLQEGEGDLAAAGGIKRNKADFALWKASKPGEPAWDSPWGPGRPGWHIECSAMCGDILGDQLDVHAGGIDLAFPHHDNEIAQSEAHYNCKQWVNYFLHTGHLHIEGQKMSKSLKNFLTIRETLEKYSATQLRIMFLLHSWDSVLDFKESSLQEVRVFESAVNNFMTNVKAVIQETRALPLTNNSGHAVNESEKDLFKSLQTAQTQVHAALCDNFDTSSAMTALRDLIASTNTYLRKTEKASPEPLSKIAGYISKMLRIFGVYGDANPEFGDIAVGKSSAGGSVEEVAGPYVRLLAAFRDKVRELARSKADPLEYLKITDQLRDEGLVDLNVALDDRDDGRALVKFVDPKGATPPNLLFKEGESAGLYSKWDEKGIPTHKADGEEISRSGLKKMQKQYEAQEKLHEKYLAWKAKQ
ncbi:tRNA synthetases class I (C) catalytic domain-containing protein [Chytridium lagenaria]|nr:tRNA synthetases class I (C) catalytic domain-containing protein [Chytridium lagenaria]